MKTRKVLALLLALALVAGLAACGGKPATADSTKANTETTETATEPTTETTTEPTVEPSAEAVTEAKMDKPLSFKVAYVENPDTAMGTIMPKAFEKITELTNGDLQFEMFPSGLLGTNADVAEQIANGAPIIGTVGMDSLIPTLSPLATPYVLENIDETLAFSKTEYYQNAVEELKDAGYMPICMGSLGIRHIISTREITCAADFDGLIIRMAATEPSQGFATVLGGTPVTSSWSDIYTMLSTGSIEATEAPVDLLYSTALYEVCDYLCMSAHLTTPFQFVMSTDYWNQIPEAYQTIILDTMADACAEMAEQYKQSDSEYVQKFKDAGVTVCEDPDIESFSSILPDLFKYLGWDTSVYDNIRASIDAVM